MTHPVGTDGVLLGAWARVGECRHLLDIGTGTGLIALMLAQRTEQQPDTHITAVEIHHDSRVCASRNFAASPWAGRLHAVEQRIQDFTAAATRQYDLIVSNPPFFSEAVVSPDPARRLGRTAIALSLAELLDAVNRLLAPDGRFCTILPQPEGQRLCEQGATKGLYCTGQTLVHGRAGKSVERLLLQLERNPYPFEREVIEIYAGGNEYSEAFRAMTREFYLHF